MIFLCSFSFFHFQKQQAQGLLDTPPSPCCPTVYEAFLYNEIVDNTNKRTYGTNVYGSRVKMRG